MSPAGADAPEVLDEPASPAAPRVPMVVSAVSWSHNLVLGRSGREESESIVLVGQIAWRGGDGERRVAPARVLILAKDARLRLGLTLSPQEAVLTSRWTNSRSAGCRSG